MDKKTRGKNAEDIAAERLVGKGLSVCDRNRTMRGGELDIVGYMEELLVVVEVRSVDLVDDLHGYTSATKLKHLLRSVEHRIHIHKRTGAVRLDVVYVRGAEVIQRFQNITNE